ncbi:MAG: LysM peptidoglycan-binding domain-containing protein [Anaerolineae bacterium]
MDFDVLRQRYLELKAEFESEKLDEAAFQKAVDGLQTQDEWGRYWMIGAQSGEWYYYNGQEWAQADPAETYKLPYIDEEGRYWMIGAQSGEWYYYDGEAWVLPDSPGAEPHTAAGPQSPPPAGDNTQYYQDDEGRYWALGAKSGEWYFYDETGWHRSEDLPGQAPASPPPSPQPQPGGVQVPAAEPAYQPAGRPGEQPYPAQQVYQPAPAYQPQAGPYPAGTTPGQAYAPPQPYPPGPQPTEAAPEVPIDAATERQAGEPSPPAGQGEAASEPPQPGTWYYFDGERWLRYAEEEEAPDAAFANESSEMLDETAAELPGAKAAEVDIDLDLDEELAADQELEVVEVSEEDIIDLEEEVVEADFEIEVIKPGEETPEIDEELAPTRAIQPIRAGARTGETQGVPVQRIQPDEPATEPQPRVLPAAARGAPQAQARAESSPRSFSVLLWTALGGLALLALAFIVIVGARVALDNQEQLPGVVAVQDTPTLDAGPPPSTPTPGPTPVPTDTPVPTATSVPLASYRSPALGFAIDYPNGWLTEEGVSYAAFGPSARALNLEEIRGATLWVSMTADGSPTIPSLLADGLALLPPNAETLTEGTVRIGGAAWTSAQVRFFAPGLDGDAVASLAVTLRDDIGYSIIAVAPAEEWNDFSPLFQYAIDTFQFTDIAVAGGERPAGNTPTPAPTATLTPTLEPVVYEVQPGDTLGGIAIRFEVEVEDIMAANGLTDPSLLRIGQELIIPVGEQGIAAAPTGQATDTPLAPEVEATEATPTAAPQATGEAETPTATPQPTPTPAATPTPEPPAEVPLSGRIIYPAWSPDINGYNIWLSDLAGAEQTIVAGNASQPAFSRDGSLLAYRSWDSSARGLYFIDFVGGRRGQMAGFLEDALPTWSPDGTTVAFTTRREGDRVSRVYRVGQMGGDDRSIGFNAEYADTLPDGRLVVKGCSITGDCGLWVMLPDGGGEIKIAGDGSDTAPAANPVTGKIAFMSFNRGGAGNWEIWSMQNDGSDLRRLTDNPANDGLPTWSPDGLTVAFVSDRGGVWAVWAMNADGSNQRKLFDMKGSPDGVVYHDEPNSRGWLEERISWAP